MNIFEAIQKCKAQGLITMPAPVAVKVRATRQPNKQGWTDEARERQRVNQRKTWTPERRAMMSKIMKERLAARRATAGLEQLREMQARDQRKSA